jgi:hypothetical protein
MLRDRYYFRGRCPTGSRHLMPLDDSEVARTAAKPLRWNKLLIGADHMRVKYGSF